MTTIITITSTPMITGPVPTDGVAYGGATKMVLVDPGAVVVAKMVDGATVSVTVVKNVAVVLKTAVVL